MLLLEVKGELRDVIVSFRRKLYIYWRRQQSQYAMQTVSFQITRLAQMMVLLLRRSKLKLGWLSILWTEAVFC